MKKALAVLLAIATVFGCAACSSQEESTTAETGNESAEYKDTLVIATSTDPGTFDPRAADRDTKAIAHNMVYDTLFRIGPNNETLPCLATEWEFLDDTTLRVHLREGVKFHNGMEMTAEDVYYSYARAKEDSVSASTMSFLDIENTVIQDPYTIDLKFFEPYAPVFNTLSQASGRAGIGCKAVFEEIGDEEYARNPVGTGPYMLVDWQTDSSLTFTRFDDYWEGTPATKNIELRIIPEAANRVIALETGEVDFAFFIESNDIERVEELDGYHIEQAPSARYFTVTLSMQEPLFEDQRVRYAMSYAIDKEALVQACFGDGAEVLKGMYSPTVFGYKEIGLMPYDLEEAKRLMAEAGYEDGFEIELHVIPTQEFQRLAEVIQEMWSQINITANIVTVDLATYEAQNGGKWQAAIRDGSATEPSNILIIYDSSFGSRLQGNNPEIDEMLATAKTIYDDTERAAYYGEIQQYLYDLRYTIPFACVPVVYGVSDKIEGFEFNQIVFMTYNTIKVRN